jgi:hypothetical protein
MSGERLGNDPISQLAELVVHRIHALKQKEKFKKFQPLRKPGQNPYAKEGSTRPSVGLKYRPAPSHSEGRRPVDQDAPHEKRSIIVTEENVQLPKIPFHQRSFEQKYRDELREFKKMNRHFRQDDKQRSQSRILDEVINRQMVDDEIEFSTFNYTMEEPTVQSRVRQPSIGSRKSKSF